MTYTFKNGAIALDGVPMLALVRAQWGDGVPTEAALDALRAKIVPALNAAELKNPNPRYVIDGHEFADEDSDLAGDGTFPPFGILDTEKQDYVLPFYPTREAAEAALALLCPATLTVGDVKALLATLDDSTPFLLMDDQMGTHPAELVPGKDAAGKVFLAVREAD